MAFISPQPCDNSSGGTVFQHEEILCDDNGAFVRKFIQDVTGAVTSVVDFTLEGVPYVVVGTVTLCSSSGGSVVFQHEEILCDDNGPFVRKYIQNAAGLVLSVVDFELDGTPYVVVGTVQLCSSGSTSNVFQHEEVFCDDNGPFVRKYIQDVTGLVTSVVDFELDGTPYVVVGPVVLCSSGSTSNVFQHEEVFCDDNGPFVRKYIQDVAGLVTSVVDFEVDGTPYVVVGPVVLCPIETTPSIFQHEEILCDDLGPFIRKYIQDASGTVLSVVDLDLNGGAYAVSGTVEVCPAEATVSVFQHEEILCDDNGPFVRKYIQNSAGTVTSVVNFDLEGAPYVVVGTVTVCPSEATVTVFQHEEILCDDNGPFVRKFIQNSAGVVTSVVDFDLEGAPYIVVGTVTVCPSDATVTVFQHEEILCDDNGPFIRKFIQNAAGLVLSVVDLDLSGGAYAVSGTVEVCPAEATTNVFQHEEILCDLNGPFIRKFIQNAAGLVLSVVDIDLGGAAYAVSGTVGVCPSEATVSVYQHEEILCDDNGSFIRKFIQDAAGIVLDVVDLDLNGGAYAVSGTVYDCNNPPEVFQELTSTVERLTGAGSIAVPGGYKSVTIVVFMGNPTVTIDADPPITLVQGMSLTWAVDDRSESLLDPFVFTGFAGSDFYVTTTSGPIETDLLTSTIDRLTGAGSINIPANASSVTITVIAGVPTVQIAAGPIVALVQGMSLTWAVDAEDEDLLDAFTFTGVLGDDFIVTSTRL